ncbi:MAG: glycosyltransferase family 2 protein [Candidatus Aenigmarchaeota archaeon]|nr:glycosyltransferase family 2 protein [Candidatus Aenigmarchaeota archaeon]
MNIGVLIPAYNAGKTLANVIQRIPKRVSTIIVVDDGSSDNTYEVAKSFKKVITVRHEKNGGYGAAQKTLFREALKRKVDVMVVLVSDKQSYPEEMVRLITPIEERKAEVVLGSRVLGNMKRGKMPLYKRVGNKLLTRIENMGFSTNISSFHDAYKAVTREALQRIDFESFTDGYLFDTYFLVSVARKKMRFAEVPVTTYYEKGVKSGVNSLKYGLDIIWLIILYRLGYKNF